MALLIVVHLARDDFAAGHGQIDMHFVEVSLPLVMARGLDRNVAPHDVRIHALKMLGQFPHPRLESFGGLHVAKRNL